MRLLHWAVLAVALLAFSAPTELWAQGRGNAHGKQKAKNRQEERVFVRENRNGETVFELRGRDQQNARVRGRKVVRVRNFNNLRDDDVIVLRDRNGRVVVVDRDDIEDRFQVNHTRGRGPAFCRSGAGHPVFGRQWCIEKGWGLGNRTVFFDNDDRVIFRSGSQLVVARVRDDRSTIERIVDRILFWTD